MRSTVLAVALLLPVAAYARPPSLPDPFDTPGAVNPAVNQANIGSTICQPVGPALSDPHARILTR